MTVNEDITIDDVIKMAKEKNKKIDSKMIMRAYDYAVMMHGDQCRKSGEPYIIHPLNVAYILSTIGLDSEAICAALLHDVVEDTEATRNDIVREFGEDVAELVDGVTKLGQMLYTSVEEQQIENYRKMFLAMGKDIRVILIKLADRLHNMRTLKFLSRDRQIANARETMDLYAPLANRLGIYSLKWELEDLAFKYLYPDEYHEIVKGLDQKRDERLSFIEGVMDEIRAELKKAKIEAEVTGRAKHLYSIYRKMKRDNKSLDEIYDLFALRILVNSVRDCYTVLGIVHDKYNPMPGRFKDYIATPKKNMYQSIHTTLIGHKTTPFEVQIRTWDMHRIAEYGIAAHWAYKEASNKGTKQSVIVTEDKLAWLRETLEWQKDTESPSEFISNLKKELFEDEVYVFTPKGDIKVLPNGSTAIDLAYTIHEQVGNRMVGVKINTRMMPIVTKLKNGDIVEIITSDSSNGPSRDWLKFVKSSIARNRIQRWFKKAQREENIEKGKEAVEKEIKKIGMKHSDLFKQEWVNIALDRYKYSSLEDMYSSIGFGAISASKIVARLLEEYRKENNEEDIEAKIQELTKKKVHSKPSQNGVIVEGIDNCLVKLSKCCNPLPGDNIVGYITKGRGVSVHRADCVNVKDLLSEENRMIDVYWENTSNSNYSVEVQVFANDRTGLLADIIKEITGARYNILGFNTRTTKEKIAIVDINLELVNLEDLNKVINMLKKVSSVYDVKRKR